MKLVLALAVLATSAASIAASSDIYDIMYLPNAGTTYGFSTLSFSKSKAEYDNGEGSQEDKTSGFAIDQTIGHSLTDRLALQAAINYTSLEAQPDEGSDYDAVKGLSDLFVGARYRLMDEDFRFDLLAGATLGLMDAEADLNDDGNFERDNLQGGHSLFIGAQFGAKSENFQWAIGGQLAHNLEAETEISRNGETLNVEDDAHNVLQVRGDILNKLAEKSFLRSNVAVEFSEEFKNNRRGKTPPMTSYQIGTEYQHLASQDLLLKAGVDYTQVKLRSGQVDSLTGWAFRVGANYQF